MKGTVTERMNKANERKCIIAMSSMTYAMRGETLLNNNRLYTRVIKLPKGSTPKGCGYGLELSCSFLERAVQMLEHAGIKHGIVLR